MRTLLEQVMEERPEEIPEKPGRDPVLYVMTRTIRAGRLTEVECYPVYRMEYRRKLQRVRPTAAAVQAVNDRNARKRFERMAEANFRPGIDYALTLTYAGQAPEGPERCDKDLRNYMVRVNRARKRAGLAKARAMGVIEVGKNGRLHHHMLVEGGLPRDEMERLWGKGYANCDRIQVSPSGMAGLIRYMTKGFSGKRDKGRHRYFYTRNLRQPRITESRTRISRRQAERIREDADLMGAEIIRRKWPGQLIDSIEVRQTDWMPGCYITVRMYNAVT